MKIISLGWGRESFTLAAMSAFGDLPPVDAAVFADTTHERTDTYTFAAKWTPWLEDHDVRVVTVHSKYPPEVWQGKSIPAYSAAGGKALRTCTHRWKILPIRKWLQANRAIINRRKEPVEQWIGITLNEIQRIKTSDVKYITNRFPLVEHRMTRTDCEHYLLSHDLEIPPKSACVFCPLHAPSAWRTLLPQDHQKAINVDTAIRHARPNVTLFLSDRRVPLTDLPDNPEDAGQLSMFNDECTGSCFL